MGGHGTLPPLSLEPLADLPGMTNLVIWGRRVTHVATLQGHDLLAGLHLGELGSRRVLEELPRLPDLRTLGLGGMSDLADLEWLRRLTTLGLRRSGRLDLAPVAGLPALRRFGLGYGPLPDLRPLRESPALAVLEVRGVPAVDPGALAGREGLTVEVDRSAIVHDADRLGAGSRVVRR